jgi:dTMP kinase
MLEAGTLILCDRYAFSGVAFSAAKGLPLEWCRMPDVGLPAPDVTLFFDVSPEVARARGGYGEERYEKEEIQARVRDMFGRLSESCREPWVTVDASQSLQEVGESVWSHVHPLIHGVDTPIGRIWE